MSAPTNTLWLIIPAWREAERLDNFAARLLPALAASGLPVTLQIVDDGSPAALADALESRCRAWRVSHSFVRPLHRLHENCGKGAAIRAGWDLAVSEGAAWLGFCDADGSVDADEIVRLARLALTTPPADPTLLLASRHVPGAHARWSSPPRRLLSHVFVAWVRNHTDLQLRDTQCGAKFLPATLYRKIRPRLLEPSFAFDVELLVQARDAGATLREEAVIWAHRPGSRLCLARDGFGMMRAVHRIAGWH